MSTRFQTGLPAVAGLSVQRCGQCGHLNYPARQLCGRCLADSLQWQAVPGTGAVLSRVELHTSLEPAYAAHLPWAVASVKLDCGPVVFAHLQPGYRPGDGVTVRIIEDGAGNRLLLAAADTEEARTSAAAWMQHVDFNEVAP